LELVSGECRFGVWGAPSCERRIPHFLMQSVGLLLNTHDGLRPVGPEFGPESGKLARIKADFELQQKSIMQTLEGNAKRFKHQGNMALEQCQYRSAVKEYNKALEAAHAMMEYLEIEKPPPMNGYQLRALARGMKLPQRGPQALNPFRGLIYANRGLAFLRLDAYDHAIDDLSEACRLEPKYLKAWVRRAAALVANNRLDRALAVLDEALDAACFNDFSKELVCKLIVNVRALGNVVVLPPQDDLPVVYKDTGKVKKAKKQREKVRVPLGPASKATNETEGTGKAAESVEEEVYAEVDARDLDDFIREDWHATHLKGRWRQTRDEVTIVMHLPRRPKISELLVQIRTNHLCVLLRRPTATHAGLQDDFETIVDEPLAGNVKPAECCWILGAGMSKELHFTLMKQLVLRPDSTDDVTPHLWSRAFEKDASVDVSSIASEKAEKAQEAQAAARAYLLRLERNATQAREAGKKEEAKEIEAIMQEIKQQLGANA